MQRAALNAIAGGRAAKRNPEHANASASLSTDQRIHADTCAEAARRIGKRPQQIEYSATSDRAAPVCTNFNRGMNPRGI